MSIALKELRRRLGQFSPVLVAMTLLVVLLVVLGGFLDGLSLSQTGVLRAQGDRLLVLQSDVDLAPTRSVIPAGARDAIADIDGVDDVGRLSTLPTTATIGDAIEDVVLVGYDLATEVVPAAPGDGLAVVDGRLADLVDVAVGDTIAIGPGEEAFEVAELVNDVSAGSPTVWIDADTWLELAATVDPTSRPATQAAVVTGDVSDADVVEGVEGVEGVEVATVDEVIAADEVVTQQSGTFAGIIAVTFVVTLLVVALFFVLLTIERVKLYAVLKAVGARTRDLVTGLAVQAVVVAVLAVALGVGLSVGLLALVPADLPIVIVPSRLGIIAGATVATAVVGALGTLRRILRIDPADAIG